MAIPSAQLSLSASVTAGVAAILASAAASVDAADWRITPAISSGAGYTDNPRLSPDGSQAYETYSAELALPMSFDNERTAISLSPRFVFASYPEDRLLDRDDVYVTLGAQRRYETAVWAASADYVRDTTLTSELGLTGFQETNRPHESLSATLSPTLLLSDRTQVGAQLYRAENTYSDKFLTGLFDYSYSLGALNARYVLTEKFSVTLQGSFGRLDAPDAHMRSDNINASAALEWQFSESWRSRFSFGPERTESEGTSSQGYIYSASLSHDGLRSGIDAVLSRDVTPTGRGVLVTRDQATLSTRYSFTEKLSGTLSGTYVRSKDAIESLAVGNQDVDYASLDVSLRWQMNENWSVVLSLGGRNQKAGELDTAQGSTASIGVAWRGDSYSWAR
jgi:hypothetical protein